MLPLHLRKHPPHNLTFCDSYFVHFICILLAHNLSENSRNVNLIVDRFHRADIDHLFGCLFTQTIANSGPWSVTSYLRKCPFGGPVIFPERYILYWVYDFCDLGCIFIVIDWSRLAL